ncbi:ribonuclease HII [Thermanaerothrix daxensis]|uniref:Ribonuclease HII n=1 Tax=Thermanaerothrix daxensis TaxID=869279 RepID=A0A0P6XFJ9_9CHLR|nr:ribonuclease HII [Thermanaerothrix daxensis]KPL82157.1 ribonuclease HII [Thermanaerothrix daxensis]
MRRLAPFEVPASPNLTFERRLWAQGARLVAGLDEAGRGAWAGPVAAGCVILPPEEKVLAHLSGLRDSKQHTPAQRERWAERIRGIALAWGVGMASVEEIDRLGILPATRLAMMRALEAAAWRADYLLIDALRLPELDLPQLALIKGDQRALSIAAAAVLAKTARDARMREYDAQYPGYGFAHHKGYGVPAHRAALARLGPCPLHRHSFAPVRQALAATPPP